MKFKLILLSLLITFSYSVTRAQNKYFTREGKIVFLSDAPLEKISGTNKKVTSILDTESGQIEFAVLIKAFEFEKALMQEHFNENYLESDKFPKAVFKGNITNNAAVKYETDGVYPVKVSGKMTIHGVTKDLVADGTITVKSGKINAVSKFNILLQDYDIQIPKLVKDKISETVQIDADLNYDIFKSSN